MALFYYVVYNKFTKLMTIEAQLDSEILDLKYTGRNFFV